MDKHHSLNSFNDELTPLEAPTLARHKTLPPNSKDENPLVSELSVLSPGTNAEAADLVKATEEVPTEAKDSLVPDY